MLKLQDLTVQQYCRMLQGDFRLIFNALSMEVWARETSNSFAYITPVEIGRIIAHLQQSGWGTDNPNLGWHLVRKSVFVYVVLNITTSMDVLNLRMKARDEMTSALTALGREWGPAPRWVMHQTYEQAPRGWIVVIEMRLQTVPLTTRK
jgi:hypothetical protein